MEITDSDIHKIELITVHTQVAGLVHVLRNIKKEILVAALSGILPEDRNTLTYRMMEHTLEFYNNIDDDLQNEEITSNN